MYSVIAKITLPCVFFALASCAQADEATAVLERAIQAHGGAARLERTKRGHIKAEMKGKLPGNVFQVTWEETFDLPNRYRWKIEGTKSGSSCDMELGFDGRKGWSRQGQFLPQDARGGEPLPLESSWHA